MIKTFWYKPDFWMNYDRVGDNKQTLDMWINTIEKDYFAKFIQVVKQKENGDTMCLFKLRKPRVFAKNKLHFEKSSFDVSLIPFKSFDEKHKTEETKKTVNMVNTKLYVVKSGDSDIIGVLEVSDDFDIMNLKDMNLTDAIMFLAKAHVWYKYRGGVEGVLNFKKQD